MTVTLDLLCGCFEAFKVVTYAAKDGDTLFTISNRFGADVEKTSQLNRMIDVTLIHVGDIIFIPTTGLEHLTLFDEKGPKARKVSKPQTLIILGIALSIVGLIFVSTAFLYWPCYQKKKTCQLAEAYSYRTKCFSCCLYSHLFCSNRRSSAVDVHSSSKATSNFSALQKLGQGSYGSVYWGRLRGIDVAIKQMKNTKSKEFLAELSILCKVNHKNLIELIGYAAGAESLFLVYEFAQNGSLSDHLHNPMIKGYKPLSWTTRVQIALDVAKGLEYIHMHTKPYYVHRDVKTSNILLDSKYRAKVADFGLVKLFEHSPDGTAISKIVGTFGYLAPEYARDGSVTPKSDVYAFGVVLMELITGKPALSRNTSTENAQYIEHRSLVDFMLSALEDDQDLMDQLTQCVDPNLIHYHKESLLQMALLSKECVKDNQTQRPDMSKVVLCLSLLLVRSTEWEVQSFCRPRP